MPGVIDLPRPHRLLVLFLAAAVLPAAALVWLGGRLVAQEAALEARRVDELLERKTDEITAAIERDLAALTDEVPAMLDAGPRSLSSSDALVVRLTSSGVEAHAGAPLVAILGNAPPAADPPEAT